MNSKELAKKIAKIVNENKAEDVAILDMRKIVNFCDFFVICTASSDRRTQGISDAIEEEIEKIGLRIYHTEGRKARNWTLLDLGDVIIHIFLPSAREFYGLEYLWQDAPRISW